MVLVLGCCRPPGDSSLCSFGAMSTLFCNSCGSGGLGSPTMPHKTTTAYQRRASCLDNLAQPYANPQWPFGGLVQIRGTLKRKYHQYHQLRVMFLMKARRAPRLLLTLLCLCASVAFVQPKPWHRVSSLGMPTGGTLRSLIEKPSFSTSPTATCVPSRAIPPALLLGFLASLGVPAPCFADDQAEWWLSIHSREARLDRMQSTELLTEIRT